MPHHVRKIGVGQADSPTSTKVQGLVRFCGICPESGEVVVEVNDARKDEVTIQAFEVGEYKDFTKPPGSNNPLEFKPVGNYLVDGYEGKELRVVYCGIVEYETFEHLPS